MIIIIITEIDVTTWFCLSSGWFWICRRSDSRRRRRGKRSHHALLVERSQWKRLVHRRQWVFNSCVGGTPTSPCRTYFIFAYRKACVETEYLLMFSDFFFYNIFSTPGDQCDSEFETRVRRGLSLYGDKIQRITVYFFQFFSFTHCIIFFSVFFSISFSLVIIIFCLFCIDSA